MGDGPGLAAHLFDVDPQTRFRFLLQHVNIRCTGVALGTTDKRSGVCTVHLAASRSCRPRAGPGQPARPPRGLVSRSGPGRAAARAPAGTARTAR
jgi:hypothetical protein